MNKHDDKDNDDTVKDVRILPVRFDEGKERWRTLHDSAPLMVQEEFEDVGMLLELFTRHTPPRAGES